jgi:hypothetical protein
MDDTLEKGMTAIWEAVRTSSDVSVEELGPYPKAE